MVNESLVTIMKAADRVAKPSVKASSQGVYIGEVPHPFDRQTVTSFQTINEHHAACIKAKTACTVGLGWADSRKTTKNPDGTEKVEEQESKVDKVLNPLTSITAQDVMNDVGEDYFQVGEGYIEAVRRGDGEQITGIHHLPAANTHVYIEDKSYNRHYVVRGSDDDGGERAFAVFGDKEGFIERWKAGGHGFTTVNADDVSEAIQIRQSSSLSRWYGYPEWTAAVVAIELVACFRQHRYDFFLNRGVPEFMLFITGQKLTKEDWEKVENAMKANIGLGNSHKSLALNLGNENITVQLEKLAMDSKTEEQSKELDGLALSVVTAHGVPPLLAGIQIPGKLGATNELPNALMAFQLLKVGPAQRTFQQTLGATLGNPTINGGLGLTQKNFKQRTILEEMNLDMMTTVGGMRTPVTQAQAQGRDVSEGLKD